MIKNKKSIKAIAGIMVAALMMGGCAGASKEETKQQEVTPVVTEVPAATEAPVVTETPEPTAKPSPEPTPTTAPEEDDSWYQEMVEDSLISTGNNLRLKALLDKTRSGQLVRVATIGGSITEGAGPATQRKGYAYQFAKAFAKTYGSPMTYTDDEAEAAAGSVVLKSSLALGEVQKLADGSLSNVLFVNAGLSGTPSALGIMRYQRDVVEALGGAPDLLVIEFAVNDSGECTKKRAYESLIHDALTDNEDCAVILLFSVFKSKWNMQQDYIPVGSHYQLPMVSIRNAVATPFRLNKLTNGKFFADEYHPKEYGHTIMKDCLMYLLDQVDQEEAAAEYIVPANPKKAVDFKHMQLVTSAMTESEFKSELNGTVVHSIDAGAFTKGDKSVQFLGFLGQSSFPDNWRKDETGPNDSFVAKVTCKTMLLNYKTASKKDYGEADIYVDGEKVQKVNGFDKGGWNNCNVVLLIDDTEPKDHVVEIRMAEGSEDKTFTILGLAIN